MACDRLAAVWEQTGGRDGRVSLEVSPRLAHDTQATIATARRYAPAVDRPNLMIKVPATPEGLPAIEELTADGLSINVTLIFSLARHAQVMEAYLTGLERRVEQGLPLDKAIDEAAAKLPAGSPERAELEGWRGHAAIANARLAWAKFRETFATSRWQKLAARGAHVQRPLWASTSTKNPAYRDVIYVEELIGRDTVNTMPPQTLDAFNDHGTVEIRIENDLVRARQLFERLPALGVPVDRLIDQLEDEGVQAFAKSYDTLLAALESRRRELVA
jgi:transaldolase